MLGALVAAALLGAQSVPERCAVIVPHPGGTGFTHYPAPGYTVANAVPPLSLPEGLGAVEQIICGRETLAFTDNDFRVVFGLGVPMAIGAEDVLGLLEMVDGQFRFTLLQGELSSAQAAVVQAALERGQLLEEAERAGSD